MRGIALIVGVLLLLTTAAPGAAQVLQSFERLPLRVNLDDQLQIDDESGARTTGRVSRLTRDEIALQTGTVETRFTPDTVHAVARRDDAHRRGALVGAVAFAILGAVATCSHEGGDACGIVGALRAAPIGAGLGLALGALIPQMKPVYRKPEGAVSLSPARAGDAQPSLLEDLGRWVNLDDRLRVEESSGIARTGRLTGLTDTEMTIETRGGERTLTREAVRQVAVRRHPMRTVTLIGAGAGAAYGAVAACLTGDRTECPDATLIGAGVGAGAGLLAGALINRTTTVYTGTPKQTSVLPVVSRTAAGVRVTRRW